MKSCSSSEERVIRSAWGGWERPQGEKESKEGVLGMPVEGTSHAKWWQHKRAHG